MLLLLFSMALLNRQIDEESFKHYKKIGTKAYCLVDYQHKVVDCSYDTFEDCTDQYQKTPVAVCFSRKSLKLGDER